MADNNKILEAKQRINNNVCGCRGIYMGMDDSLDRSFNLLSYAIRDMKAFGIADFKIGNVELGVKSEIESTIRFLDSYSRDFKKLLNKYEELEEDDE